MEEPLWGFGIVLGLHRDAQVDYECIAIVCICIQCIQYQRGFKTRAKPWNKFSMLGTTIVTVFQLLDCVCVWLTLYCRMGKSCTMQRCCLVGVSAGVFPRGTLCSGIVRRMNIFVKLWLITNIVSPTRAHG